MKKIKQSGYALIVGLLIAMVVLTAALSVAQIIFSDTTRTKNTEDEKRARAAAEAGIEAALKTGSNVNIAGLLRAGSGLSGTANVTTETAGNSFTTPLISKDGQYTLYLQTYNQTTNTFSGSTFDSPITVSLNTPTGNYCTDSSNVNALAVELTYMSSGSGIIGRYLIDECSILTSTNIQYKEVLFGEPIIPDVPGATPQLLIARIIAPDDNFSGARLTFTTSGSLPPQGTTIISEAATNTSITKKIKFFQSYPQIPAEFFVLRF